MNDPGRGEPVDADRPPTSLPPAVLRELALLLLSGQSVQSVLQKVADGVSSDWQWYTHALALRRAAMPPDDYGRMIRDRVLRVAWTEADLAGAAVPDRDHVARALLLRSRDRVAA